MDHQVTDKLCENCHYSSWWPNHIICRRNHDKPLPDNKCFKPKEEGLYECSICGAKVTYDDLRQGRYDSDCRFFPID